MPDHKPKNERLTLALCANARGYGKIKLLLVYHLKNLKLEGVCRLTVLRGVGERGLWI